MLAVFGRVASFSEIMQWYVYTAAVCDVDNTPFTPQNKDVFCFPDLSPDTSATLFSWYPFQKVVFSATFMGYKLLGAI